ncbi:hypothetical protein J7E25_04610 [Agromyces sp. ISL-38]|uniref:hypothetical protein n=1 Tax=Agromyces sp. ISL-38 TaxID=2819107 RepID=UPI001BED31F2|nr:hypothetical protein [Agromyces sp. ISL-38]MBT2498368.1 hypothetical protein [Agromyces sp. ISL-38]MBT2518998.1 hypothetical protein [Streptomyces sp. ISL-90]
MGDREHEDDQDAESDEGGERYELLPPRQPRTASGDQRDDREGDEVDADTDLEGGRE